jgi:hypothetical protein
MPKGKLMKSLNKAAIYVKGKAQSGAKYVYLYYTREVNGKRVPNIRRLAVTGALIAAAAGGAYALKKHKKHGNVLVKKK